MTNKRFKFVIPVIALVLGMALLASCASKQYMVLDEPLKPDSRTAVVYFYDLGSTKAEIWDGEKPIGIFEGLPMTSAGCLQWKASPGSHTFLARRTNNAHLKMNLQANRTYLVEVVNIPAPYGTYVALKQIDEEREETILKRYRITDITFSDEWRQDFASQNNGKKLSEVKAYLAGL